MITFRLNTGTTHFLRSVDILDRNISYLKEIENLNLAKNNILRSIYLNYWVKD